MNRSPFVDKRFEFGEHYKVSESQIYIFNVVAFYSGTDYFVGKCFSNWKIDEASLKLVVVDDQEGKYTHLAKKLEKKLVSGAQKGCLGRMVWVLVSADVAAKMFLDETLQMRNFANAFETIRTVLNFGEIPVVILPKTTYGYLAKLPGEEALSTILWEGMVVVADEQVVGKNLVKFFDKSGLEI